MIRPATPIAISGSLFVIAGMLPCDVFGQSDHSHEFNITFDCGTLALYHLLRIEGRPTDLVVIGRRLPAMPPAGYSMLELRGASRACGLHLSGIRLKDPAREIDRPMIALLKRGHYVVVRPVGHTGKLVQILDGAGSSEIVDREVLSASSNWADLFLIPRRTGWVDWTLGALALLSGLGLLRAVLPRRKT